MSAIARQEFINAFNDALEAIAGAERITKAKLLELSRSLLGALVGHEDFDTHLTGDIQFINQLLPVLTPMNRKTAVLYFMEFSGFHYDEADKTFTKKVQKGAVQQREKTLKFLEDPLNNIWTWAERNVKVEKKAFNLTQLTKMVEKAVEETDGNTEAIILAILDGGLNAAALIAIMDTMVDKVEPAKAPDAFDLPVALF